jgi:polysaccharide export outer membrane protein
MALRTALFVAMLGVLTGCGVIYTAPGVHEGPSLGYGYRTDYDVKVVPLTYESAAAANLQPYVPARLPAAFQPGAAAASGAAVTVPRAPALPGATARRITRPAATIDKLPPPTEPQPYRIGVADVLLFSVNKPATLE